VASAGSIWFWMLSGARGWAEGEKKWMESRFWGGLCGLCWQRGKACKWCLRWLQAGGVRSGEGAATDRERWGGGDRML
jgi:hypothetical protein